MKVIKSTSPLWGFFIIIRWLFTVPSLECRILNSDRLSASPTHVFFKNYKFYQNTFSGNSL
ncbi:hypothetical protein CMU40_01300 [Elizabethkingia anophelis]|nr:hypothetical protein [Elizabethkingia anophelis]MDV3728912.1 hypothetical protein [Elizabethkingia anophelis]MDV3746022.1 hypothetical protein [Elizabethkingia anophelis]